MNKSLGKVITVSFCEPFIDRLADHVQSLTADSSTDLSRLAVVFGGKRPALFLQKELARRIGKNFFPPKFFTIDQWMSVIVQKKEPFSLLQDLDNCYLLYLLARKVCPGILAGRESFAQFLPWTREILGFIDQLDLENISQQDLHGIEANARIGYAVPKDINVMLESLVALREAYHVELQKQKTYSRGLQYLTAGRVIDECSFQEFDRIIFCNFFYFHRTEEKVVKSMFDRGMATLIVQGDERKWDVFKRMGRSFGCEIREGKEPDTPRFNLKLYSASDGHGQVGVVREILKTIAEPEQTVIVLPDSERIIPLLPEITRITQDFNISMGYPLQRSSLYALMDLMFKAQLSRQDGQYYARDYLNVLHHPFVKNLQLDCDAATARVLVHKIEEILTGQETAPLSGNLFIGLDDVLNQDETYMLTSEMLDRMGLPSGRDQLMRLLERIHQLLFRQWEEVATFDQFAHALGNFLDTFVQHSLMRNYPLNINIAQRMYEIRDELTKAAFGREEFSLEEMARIFESKISSEFIKFKGSPLKGLQVLGLFETRSLNFKHVIVMDTNEGQLPKVRIHQPLIPRDVMIALQLDRLELEEQIQRYQFMRLISSAENVYLVFEKNRENEASRFIEELVWEEEKHQGRTGVIPVTRAAFHVEVGQHRTIIPKRPEMIAALKKHRYSASSLNTYLRSPMEFYEKYVLGLEEKEDLLDEPESRQVGTFVHTLLEDAFLPFVNKKPVLNEVFERKFWDLFEHQFEESFGRSMKSDAFLLKSVLADRLKRFLEHERSEESRKVEKVMALEKHFEGVIPLSCGEVRFSYIVDRVDRLADGSIVIIDYKTGGMKLMPDSVENLAGMELTRENLRDRLRSFQIPLYFYFLTREYPGEKINAALYHLRTPELEGFIGKKNQAGEEEINRVFLRTLDFILCEILNPDIPFTEEPLLLKGAA